jgi:dihydroneopterin aldolase
MTRDRFGLSDIRFHAYHGAADHERDVDQWFSVDVELSCDFRAAAATDDLGAAVDYRDAARLVVDIGRRAPVKLMECVAGRIADAPLERCQVEAACVRLRKFSSPAPGVPGTTWIEVVRRRRRPAPPPGASTPGRSPRRRRAA